MHTLIQDLKYGFRVLRGSPGFTAVVVVTLALGIGVNTAIFGFVDRLLLRPLPFPEPARLVSLYYRPVGQPFFYPSMSRPDYLDYRSQSTSFEGFAAFTGTVVNFDLGGHVETVSGEVISANYFSVLRVPLSLGRSFLPEEDAAPGRNPVVILGHDLWRRSFSGDPGVLNRQITLNGTKFTVVGVAPAGFQGLRLDRIEKPQFWVPTMMYPVVLSFGATQDLEHYRGNQWLATVGRLRPGVTFAEAQAEFAVLTGRLKSTVWRDSREDVTALLVPANQARFSPGSRKSVALFLAMLMTVVGFVLVIACSNVASLLLARAVKRQREIAVRLALGAGRPRLLQQLLAESLLLSVMGGVAGLAVAYVTSRFLAAFERPFQLQLLLETGLDSRVLLFAFAVSVLSGVLFGAAPLRQAFKADLVSALKLDAAHFGPRGFTRNAFVVVQIALSVVLVVGAGLFVRTLRNAQATDVTRDPASVLLMNLNLSERKYNDARGKRFYADLLERVQGLEGVESAALVWTVPMAGRRSARTIVPYADGSEVGADYNIVSEDYFRTIGLPVVSGRGLLRSDREGSRGVAVINEQMARRFWPGQNPIGKQFGLQRPERLVEVVGVIRDGRFRNYRDTVKPCFYLPLAQEYAPVMSLEVRAAARPAWIAEAVRREIHAMDKGLLLREVRTLESFRNAGLGQERVSAALLSGLGILALILAAIGLYGTLAFSVARRTHEIGLRMALGASAGRVVGDVLGRALTLIAAGLCAGLAAALSLSKLTSNMLYGVTADDPLTYVFSALFLVVVGLTAALVPARRATKIDPIEALRYE